MTSRRWRQHQRQNLQNRALPLPPPPPPPPLPPTLGSAAAAASVRSRSGSGSAAQDQHDGYNLGQFFPRIASEPPARKSYNGGGGGFGGKRGSSSTLGGADVSFLFSLLSVSLPKKAPPSQLSKLPHSPHLYGFPSSPMYSPGAEEVSCVRHSQRKKTSRENPPSISSLSIQQDSGAVASALLEQKGRGGPRRRRQPLLPPLQTVWNLSPSSAEESGSLGSGGDSSSPSSPVPIPRSHLRLKESLGAGAMGGEVRKGEK